MAECPMCGYNAFAQVAGRWEISLPLSAPSQNFVQRVHYQEVRRIRLEFEQAFKIALTEQGVPPAMAARRRVTFTRRFGRGKRRYDSANLVGGCKPIVDAMVNVGLLVDDNGRWFEGHYLQAKAADGMCSLGVVIEEIEE